MNFYKHHIGDYAQATGHLSFVEDAAYSRLLRKYYADERPIPADVKAAQRLVGARSRDEKDAVQTVLDEFFELRADGWHNKRCDLELAKANAQAETNRRIAEEREARKRARQNHEPSHESLNGHVHESLKPGEHESFASREPSQTPDTRHQTPDLKTGEQGARSTAEGARVTTAGAVCIAIKAEGIAGCNPGHPKLLALLDRGAEIANFVSAARLAISRGKGFPYVLGTVEGQLEDALHMAAAGTAKAGTTNGSSGGAARAARMAEALTPTAAPSATVIDTEARDVTPRRLG